MGAREKIDELIARRSMRLERLVERAELGTSAASDSFDIPDIIGALSASVRTATREFACLEATGTVNPEALDVDGARSSMVEALEFYAGVSEAGLLDAWRIHDSNAGPRWDPAQFKEVVAKLRVFVRSEENCATIASVCAMSMGAERRVSFVGEWSVAWCCMAAFADLGRMHERLLEQDEIHGSVSPFMLRAHHRASRRLLGVIGPVDVQDHWALEAFAFENVLAEYFSMPLLEPPTGT